MRDALFDIHIIIRYLRAACPLLGEHLSFAGQQPEFVHLGEFADDTVGNIQRNTVVAPLYLIEVLTARQADISRKIVGRHIRPLDYGLDSLPIILLFSHFFSNIKIFFASLHTRSRSSMDRI